MDSDWLEGVLARGSDDESSDEDVLTAKTRGVITAADMRSTEDTPQPTLTLEARRHCPWMANPPHHPSYLWFTQEIDRMYQLPTAEVDEDEGDIADNWLEAKLAEASSESDSDSDSNSGDHALNCCSIRYSRYCRYTVCMFSQCSCAVFRCRWGLCYEGHYKRQWE